MKMYVLVSQGIEVFRTANKEQANNIMNRENDDYRQYLQDCYDNHVRPADNEMIMYEEECGKDEN